MKNQKVWLVLICVFVVILLLVGAFFMMNRNQKRNTESGLTNISNNSGNVTTNNNVGNTIVLEKDISNESLVVDNLEITNISLKYEEEMTDFSADIKNNSDRTYSDGVELVISFYREDGSIMYELPVMTGTLISGGKIGISARTTQDVTNAAKISAKIKD